MAGLTVVIRKHRKVALAAGLALVLVFVLRMRGQASSASTADTGIPIATDGTLAGGTTDTSTGAAGLTADDLAAAQSAQLAAIQQMFGDFAAAEASQLQDFGASISDLEAVIGANQAAQQDAATTALQSRPTSLAGSGLAWTPTEIGFGGQVPTAVPGNKKASGATKIPSRLPVKRKANPKPPRPKRPAKAIRRPVAKPKPKRKRAPVPARRRPQPFRPAIAHGVSQRIADPARKTSILQQLGLIR